MNYWSTSESSGVSPAYFVNSENAGAMITLEKFINRHLAPVRAGEWNKWRVIFMIFSEEQIAKLGFRETRRLTRRDMTLDFRVFVDHEPSKTADFCQCIDLLVPALERTLPYFSKAKIGKDIQEKIWQIIHIAADEAKASINSKH